MKKNLLTIKRFVLAAILMIAGLAQGWAADYTCWTYAVYTPVLKGGTATEDAGMILVSETPLTEAEIDAAATSAAMQTAPLYHFGAASACKQDYYFYAKAKPGYELLGWATTATGTPSGKTALVEENKVGDYYFYVGTTSAPYSNNTEEKATKFARYAVFEKMASADDEPTGEDGAAFVSVTGNEYIEGTASKNPYFDVFFAKNVSYYGPGTGSQTVNADVVKYITVKGKNGNSVSANNVSVAAYGDAVDATDASKGYTNGRARISLPYSIKADEYTVHLPYGLFKTVDGGVTAACDVQFNVIVDTTPLTLVATSPAAGGSYNLGDDETADGTSLTVSFTFNKAIDKVNEGKEFKLVNKTSGQTFELDKYGYYNSYYDKKMGAAFYPAVPNGLYELTVPADVFVGANGLGNEALTLSFSVVGSTVADWVLPTYNSVVATPSNNENVRSLTQIAIDLSREGYDAPVGLMPNAPKVVVNKITEVYTDEITPNAPEGLPDVVSEEITGFKTSVKNGQLLITFSPAFADTAKIMVSIPAGIVNNLAMPVATMEPKEIYEEGGCTNTAITLTYNVCPQPLKIARITNQGTGNGTFDGGYQNYDYVDLVDAKLTPNATGSFGSEDVTYIFFWFDETIANVNKEKLLAEAYVKNVTTGKDYYLSQFGCGLKNVGDKNRDNVIQLALSSDSRINSAEYHQGEYEVYLPAGIASSTDGMLNESVTFHFTYGDPEKAYIPEAVDLAAYVGSYTAVVDENEVTTGELETFTFGVNADGYYITDIAGSDLQIPVVSVGGTFTAPLTSNDNWLFCSTNAGDVVMTFAQQGGKCYIFLGECIMQDLSTGKYVEFGGQYFELGATTAIRQVLADKDTKTAFDLSGRAVTKLQSGKTYIINGVKVSVK